MFRKSIIAAGIAVAALAVGAPTANAATCINKAGQGTGAAVANAEFQAWEAVLQATSWGMWANWMASSQQVGVAPGYKVSNLKKRCKPGGLGQECHVQATLCQ